MELFSFILYILPLLISFNENWGKKLSFLVRKNAWPVWEVNFYVICHSGNEKVAGLQRLAGLRWPVYGGNFIKDPMGVWPGNELLAGLERLAGLQVAGLKGFTVGIL